MKPKYFTELEYLTEIKKSELTESEKSLEFAGWCVIGSIVGCLLLILCAVLI